MMTLSEKRQPKSKRFGLGFSVRTLLVSITLVAIVLAIYEPLTLHFKAVHFFNLKNSVRATRPHPETLLYNIVGDDNAVVCHVGKVRIVLLGRTHRGATTSGFIPIAGDKPLRGGDVSSVTQEAFFSYSYANGQAECDLYGFPFLCREGTVEIKKQSFDSNSQTVILVAADDQVLRIYSP